MLGAAIAEIALVFFVFGPKSSKKHRAKFLSEKEIEVTESGNLFDSCGKMRQLGWSRKIVKTYNREDIVASPLFIKEWDYYAVIGNGHILCITVSDIGYAGTLIVSVIENFNNGKKAYEYTDTLLTFFTLGGWNLPRTTREGVTAGKIGENHFEIKVSEDGKRVVTGSWPTFGTKDADRFKEVFGELGLTVEITLSRDPELDTIVVHTPFKESARYFYYNQKINNLRAVGTATIGNVKKTYARNDNGVWGILDWGRGVWPYASSWVWASANGMATVKDANGSEKQCVFALNMGHGFGVLDTHSENCVFLDGKIVKFGKLEITYNKNNFMDPWHFSDKEGNVDLTLTPSYPRVGDTNFVLLRMLANQMFGTFSGTVKTDDGRVVTVSSVEGFAEFVSNRW